MYIRNHKGKMVFFNWRDYSSEKEMYCALWKISYNIDLNDEKDYNKELVDFIS